MKITKAQKHRVFAILYVPPSFSADDNQSQPRVAMSESNKKKQVVIGSRCETFIKLTKEGGQVVTIQELY